MLRTKNIYQEMCMKSPLLHRMSDEERKKLQNHLRSMYLDIEKVCDRHGLQVMVAFGSLLGAVRHQGFIPWDDDMDLLMPREDYDKFVNDYADELPKRYKVYAPAGRNGAIARFAKVVDTHTRFIVPGSDGAKEECGIFVDIFPLEHAPVNKWTRKVRMAGAYFLMYVAGSVSQYKNKSEMMRQLMNGNTKARINYRFRNCIGCFFSFYSLQTWYKLIDRFVQWKADTGFYCWPAAEASTKSFTPKARNLFFPLSRGRFDDIEVYLPAKSVELCELHYGNWQRIPAQEERWQHFIVDIRFEDSGKS